MTDKTINRRTVQHKNMLLITVKQFLNQQIEAQQLHEEPVLTLHLTAVLMGHA